MSETYYLYARPSFTEGMARVIDLGNTLAIYNESETGQEADNIAIHLDWNMIGQDIFDAISENDDQENVKQKSE